MEHHPSETHLSCLQLDQQKSEVGETDRAVFFQRESTAAKMAAETEQPSAVESGVQVRLRLLSLFPMRRCKYLHRITLTVE